MRLIFSLLCTVITLPAADLTRGPYLQQSHSSGITVVWRTQGAMTQPLVHYWQEGQEPQQTKEEAILIQGKTSLSVIPDGQVQYEATLSGLNPSSSYHYAIYDGADLFTEKDAPLSFWTHPSIGQEKDTRVWVVGDSGTGEKHQRQVHTSMQIYSKDRPIDLYLHVGDMAYGQGTDQQFQDKFFQPYQATLQNTVCWASMGNHEGKSSNGNSGVGPFFDAYVNPTRAEAGGLPSGNESFYSFDYGTAHFICLNSYDVDRSPRGEMAQWLQRDLAATQAKWIIGFWHHPPYTKGTHDSDREKELIEMRESIMPILETGGVDIVLSGHSHIYERSMLIDGAYQTPTTAEGVVLDDGDGHSQGDGAYQKPEQTGHGGALGRNSKGVMPIMKSIVLDHGSTILDISGDTLNAVMIDLNGKERDRFQIKKQGEAKNTIIQNPKVATRQTEERTGAGVMGSAQSVKASKEAQRAGKKQLPKNLPSKTRSLIAPHAQWDYLAHGEKPETEMWTQVGFDAAEEGWKTGEAGFGYGDNDDRTVLSDMPKKKYTQVFIRKEFDIPADTALENLGLAINYDDGFVLHLNGKEILSRSVTRTANGKLKVAMHEASGHEYYSLRKFAQHFVRGKNVIAIEGLNQSPTSSDFSLDPYLLEDLSAKH